MISSPCFRPSGSFLCFGVSITHGRILSAWTKVTVLAPFTGPLPKRRDTNGLIFTTIGPLLLCAFAWKFLFSCEDGLSSLGYFRHGFLGTGHVCTFSASEMMCRLRRPPQSFTTLIASSQPRRQCATCSEGLWNTGDCEKKMSTRTVLYCSSLSWDHGGYQPLTGIISNNFLLLPYECSDEFEVLLAQDPRASADIRHCP